MTSTWKQTRLGDMSNLTSRKVSITPNQHFVLEDMFSLREDGSDEAFNLKRSVISGSDEALKALADDVEDRAGDQGDAALSDIWTDDENKQQFAFIQGFIGVLNLAAKLRGERFNARAAREAAKKAGGY